MSIREFHPFNAHQTRIFGDEMIENLWFYTLLNHLLIRSGGEERIMWWEDGLAGVKI